MNAIFLRKSMLFFSVLFALSSCVNTLEIYEENKISWEERKAMISLSMEFLETDFEKVNFLREFVVSIVRLGDSDLLCKDYKSLTVKEYYDLFTNDSIVVYCHGTADSLNKLYNEFDFHSYTWNCGDNDIKATHEFNIVEIEDGNKTKFIVQDAYFNHTLVDQYQNPLDINHVIELLEDKNDSLIHVNHGLTFGNTLAHNMVDGLMHWGVTNDLPIHTYKSKNSKFKLLIRQVRDMNLFVNKRKIRNRYYSFLKENELPPNLLYLIPFKI